MNYQNRKNIFIALFALMAVALLCLFFVFKSSKSQSLPDCRDVTGIVLPGSNCLFYGKLLCQTIPNATYPIPPSSITTEIPNHRVNCADLSDLPLCDQMDSSPNQIKNCVKECSDPTFTGGVGVRGEDFAVHNRDCIRFCDAPETGVTANPEVNCVARKCHQLASGVDPSPATCELLNCNRLTPDELNEPKFDDDTKKYCQGDNVKCLEFVESQLPFVRIRANNSMCQIHNCRTESETCASYADDDIQRIINQGQSYIDVYKTYINAGFDITSNAICRRVDCKPTFQRQYRCNPQADPSPTTLNANCDSTSTCVDGFCSKEIDCNKAENASESECITTSTPDSEIPADPTNAWFYRPKPPTDAVYPDGVVKPMGNFCYGISQMHQYGFVTKENLLFGSYYFSKNFINKMPLGSCGGRNLGNRGNGYIYLCGTNGLLYNLPDDRAAFQKGYVRSQYSEEDGIHRMTVCARFNNTMDPQHSCGKRECVTPCVFADSSDDCDDHCGSDKCKTLTVLDSDPKRCSAENTFSINGTSLQCVETIGDGTDQYIRLRAVKYGNYICSFLDLKGTLAYDAQYFNGSEKLFDGTCVSGTNVNGVCQDAKNTNDEESQANVWRTVMMVPYIQNNRPSGPRGYLDLDGRLFKEQECPKVPYRIQTPRTFNLSNINNSPALFSPPIYILNARVQRGGAIAIGSETNPLGFTDFHFPQIEVKFGATTKLLSLGIGFTGYETNNPDPLASATIQTTIAGFDYEIETFVRKELDSNDNDNPLFCLYRRVRNELGAEIDPLRIGCVKRNLPEIDNTELKTITPSIDLRKLLIYPDASNSFDSSQIALRYLSSSNINASNCSSSGTSCTNELLLKNDDQTIPTCDNLVESHRVCVQRDECSKLNVECVKNEIDINNAINNNQSTDSFLTIRKNCQEFLMPLCNNKKGLSNSGSSDIADLSFNSPALGNFYGWFNEICIVSGFEKKLLDVVAYQTTNGTKGKCLVDANSPYLTDGNSTTNCDLGGKAPNCLCVKAVEGVDPGSGFEVRKQTPHEAGLCVDMPLPQTCPTIDYNQTPNTDPNDLEYVSTSLNNTVYGSSVSDISSKVHISHRYRTEGKAAPNEILLRGHAEFPKSVIGATDVNGDCKGFWTYDKTAGGVSIKPKLNCINNNGNAIWETNARNACVRYQCNSVTTLDPDVNGLYQNGYGNLESGENKGLSNGFALWPSYLKTTDFPEAVSATSCITGFKKSGAATLTSSGTVSGQNAINAAIYNLITGYSGGSLPTRNCNQLGQFLIPSNSCQRITCPADNPPTPTSSTDSAAWSRWQNSGGANFSAINASRSASRIQNESVAIGTCNESLGFFKNPGGQNPTRNCDHLGNWSSVTNPCVTTCEPITNDVDGSNFNNGFALWNTTTGTFEESGIAGVFNRCVAGYVTNPYPPTQDINGNALPPATANDLNRPAENPKRLCKSGSTPSGVQANVWGATVNGCINQCPGSTQDSRIGVGITTHNITSGTVNVNWPATALGQDAYVSNFNTNLDASYFTQGRTNGYYLLKRHCNANGQWSTPEPMCAANSGQVGNATYDLSTSISGYADSIAAGTSAAINGSCVTGYQKYNFGNDPAPRRSCVFESGNTRIDKVYLTLINSTQDCEELTCPTYPITKFDRSKIAAQVMQGDVRTKVNGQIQAVCLNNETNSAGTTMFTSLPTGSAAPYVTCQSNGTWSAIINDTNCKKGCDVSQGSMYIDPKDCGGGYTLYRNATSLAHGEKLQHFMYMVCGDGTDDCDGWAYAGSCDDGVMTENNRYVNGGEIGGGSGGNQSGTQCPFASYNYTTGTWPVMASVQYGAYIRFSSDTKGRFFKNKYNVTDKCNEINNTPIGNNVTYHQPPRRMSSYSNGSASEVAESTICTP